MKYKVAFFTPFQDPVKPTTVPLLRALRWKHRSFWETHFEVSVTMLTTVKDSYLPKMSMQH